MHIIINYFLTEFPGKIQNINKCIMSYKRGECGELLIMPANGRLDFIRSLKAKIAIMNILKAD